MVCIEEMASFCKKKGFAYINSEIYGGLSGFWDFGPLGVEMKNNIKNELWKRFVQQRSDVVGIDGAIITHQKVWEASGHVTSFSDVLLECKKCKKQHRGDLLIEDTTGIAADGIPVNEIDMLIKKHKIKCPHCKGELKIGKTFNLMFNTYVGAVENESAKTYLRPETAQLIFTNFRLVQETSRLKLPFGIAQTGKAFRNEISPRDFLFRSREFEMFEIEYFTEKNAKCPYIKDVDNLKVNILSAAMQEKREKHITYTIGQLVRKKIFGEWQAYWLGMFYKWFLDSGIKKDNLRLREHTKEELSHYATACFDIEYNFPFGWKEIHGNANRGQYDLKQHMEHSKKDMAIFDEASKKKILPYVAAEPSQGIERAMLAFLFDAYHEDRKRGNIVLKLSQRLSSVKVAVFPLVSNNKRLIQLAGKIYEELRKDFNCFYDQGGSIGRRYARMDEIGTPYCVTVDFDSLKDKSVTIRDRDTTKQRRVKIKGLKEKLKIALEHN